MTQTFATNANNDFVIGTDGNLTIVTGIQAVMTACASAARAQMGEMILQQTKGMPTAQTIWSGVPDPAIYEAKLRTTLLAVDGVNSIESLTISIANNTFGYTAVIVTEYGQETLNG